MEKTTKDWLVRTRTREILGPYTERELLDELRRQTFSAEDEIAPSEGRWISAQALATRDFDEFTNTQTKNQTITKSLPTGSFPERSDSTLTPTPEIIPRHVRELRFETTRERKPLKAKRPSTTASKVVGFLTVMGLVWLALAQMNANRKAPTNDFVVNPIADMPESILVDNPVIREALMMIRSGDKQGALQKLSDYHNSPEGSKDLEHLVPLSALLIMEAEQPSRAKQFLETILSSSNASPQLKANAHHWMGYLLLSTDQGDRGESHFLETLQINPKDAAARFNLGRTYLKQERFTQALDYLQLAELEMPDLWLVHLYKAQAKALLGHTEEARAAFKIAVDASPDRWLSYIYYAVFLQGIGENEAAQQVMKKMLARDPDYELWTPAPWRFFNEKINRSVYLNAFLEVMERAPVDDKEMGRTYLRYLIKGSAGSELKKLDLLSEKSVLARLIWFKVALDSEAPLRDLKAALAKPATERIVDLGAYAMVLRGEARARLAMYPEAEADFKMAIGLEPKNALAHWAAAKLMQKTHRDAEALDQFKSLVSYHPDYIPAIVWAQRH